MLTRSGSTWSQQGPKLTGGGEVGDAQFGGTVALSADGRYLAFVANGDKGTQLWLRPLDQVSAQPLAGTEGADYPFWAPDARAIGFFADGKLKRIDLTGGAVRALADAPTYAG